MYHLHYISKKLFRMIFAISGKVDYRVSVLCQLSQTNGGSCTTRKSSELVLGLSEDRFNL
jgi:hypothetical protein